MEATITVRLDAKLDRLLDEVSKESNLSRSEIVRDALRRHLMVARFNQLRKEIMPYAEAVGFFTDEDVFAEVP